MLFSECARLLLLNLQFIFYANGFQNTTNTGLLPFSAQKANVIISINTELHGSSFSDNASLHVSALNSEPTSCQQKFPHLRYGGLQSSVVTISNSAVQEEMFPLQFQPLSALKEHVPFSWTQNSCLPSSVEDRLRWHKQMSQLFCGQF